MCLCSTWQKHSYLGSVMKEKASQIYFFEGSLGFFAVGDNDERRLGLWMKTWPCWRPLQNKWEQSCHDFDTAWPRALSGQILKVNCHYLQWDTENKWHLWIADKKVQVSGKQDIWKIARWGCTGWVTGTLKTKYWVVGHEWNWS